MRFVQFLFFKHALEEVLITIAGKKQEVTMLLDRRELGRALLEV